MLGGAASRARRVDLGVASSYLLETAQAVIHRRLRQLHPAGQLAKVQLRVLPSPARHLLEGRGQCLEHTAGFQRVDGRRLPETRPDRLADVGRLEVEAAVDPAA